MDSDDCAKIDDPDDAAWVAAERQRVIEYLADQGVEHAGVSAAPRWFVSPYLAIWAARSRTKPDFVGWWAISGDVPTDYMTCRDQHDVADVLIAFAKRWSAAAERMAAGEQPDGFTVGDPQSAKELAPLLASRAALLQSFGERMKRGELLDED